jgi:MFS-type transporter involved in bile tolerance (Atg22 family)
MCIYILLFSLCALVFSSFNTIDKNVVYTKNSYVFRIKDVYMCDCLSQKTDEMGKEGNILINISCAGMGKSHIMGHLTNYLCPICLMTWKIPIPHEALKCIYIRTHIRKYSYKDCYNAVNRGELECYFLLLSLIINIHRMRINRKKYK